MKIATGIALATLMAASSALADPNSITCKRYKSKCVGGDACYHIAEGLSRDVTQKILPASSTEKVVYQINGDPQSTGNHDRAGRPG